MDREKAIQILKRCEAESYCNHYKQHYCCIGCGQREALDLAIEALVLHDKYVKALDRMIEGAKEINRFLDEAVEKSDEKHQLTGETSTNSNKNSKDNLSFSKKENDDLISRQAVIGLLLDAQDGSGQTYEVIRELLHEVAYMPSVSEEEVDYCNNCPYLPWGEDCISRAKAIEEVKALPNTDNGYSNTYDKACIIGVLEELPSVATKSVGDCISRADTIKAICAECTQEGYDECRADCTEVAVVKGMPPVTPPKKVVAQISIDTEELIERIKEEYEITDKVGEWIYGNGHGECSVCKHERQYGWDNYCGNCGAKMR